MSAIPADLRLPNPWRVALPAIGAVLALILLLHRDTAATMVSIWLRSETFAHAILVPPISLWLIWRQRERLAALIPSPRPWLLLPLAGAAVLWLLADLVVVNAAAQFALVFMLILAVPAVLGLQVAGVILFPLLFLLFSVPFGEFMLPAMMEWTADFVVMSLQLTGVPVFREGLHFVIPSGNWSVIDECSGVRYLMASFMVGAMFAYLNYRSYRKRAVFMLVSIAVPIVANWLRAYFIVMLAHLSGNKLATGVDHILYGWVFFGVIILIMFAVGSRWSEPDASLADQLAADAQRQRRSTPGSMRSLALTGLLLVVAIGAPHLLLWQLQRVEGAAAPAALALPSQLSGGWASPGAPRADDWAPTFLNPSVESRADYDHAAGRVSTTLVYYRGQGVDRKLVSSTNILVPMRDRQWNLLSEGGREVRAGGQSFSVRTAQILEQGTPVGRERRRLVVWRIYWIDGRFVGSDVMAKLVGAKARLLGRGDEGAALVLHADAGNVEASHALLQAFMDANATALDALLQRTRDTR